MQKLGTTLHTQMQPEISLAGVALSPMYQDSDVTIEHLYGWVYCAR